jgi:hypothetical protein
MAGRSGTVRQATQARATNADPRRWLSICAM